MDDLRTRFTEEMKAAMKAGDAPRTSTIRMILARLKETDIAARPSGVEKVPDEQIAAMLRGKQLDPVWKDWDEAILSH